MTIWTRPNDAEINRVMDDMLKEQLNEEGIVNVSNSLHPLRASEIPCLSAEIGGSIL